MNSDSTPLPLDSNDPLWHAMRDYLNRQATPAAVIQKHDRRICLSNETFSLFGTLDLIGKTPESILDRIPSTEQYKPCRFQGHWYLAVEKPLPRTLRARPDSREPATNLLATTDLFSILQLQEPGHLPSIETIRTLRQMTAVLLHRFRSPLTGMQGHLELMDEDPGSRTQHQRLKRIQDQLDRLFELMDRLEELYHLPETSFDSDRVEPIDLHTLTDSLLHRLPSSGRVHIRVEPPRSAFSFTARRDQTEAILLEIASNAVESCTDSECRLTLSLEGDQTLRVHNNGPAIPEEIARRVFEPFVTTRASHLGIGLTRASMLAALDGGSIFLTDNSTAHGVSFTLCLPDLVSTF